MQRRTSVYERLRRGQRGEVVNGRLEPFAVGVLGVGAEERELGVERLLPASSGPAIQTGPTSLLSSQNRMNTVVSTHATAAWVTRSSRQATQVAAVRSLSRAR